MFFRKVEESSLKEAGSILGYDNLIVCVDESTGYLYIVEKEREK